jgi:RNA polymerase sigma factor (TIGR02999 family)
MTDVTRILSQIEHGDLSAADELLPLVYDELRRLAAARMSAERPGQTLQPTALVHEAYLRLVNQPVAQGWNGRNHFFAAAAEAMRRILVEKARRKSRTKHGGQLERQEFDAEILASPEVTDQAELLAIDEALGDLAADSPRKAELVKLRYFLGFGLNEAAEVLGVSASTAEQDWRYAKAWLRQRLSDRFPG